MVPAENRNRFFMQNYFSHLSPRQAWSWWIAVALASCGIQCLTLSLSPPIWMDETMIVDYGRTALFEPHSDWAIYWSSHGRPVVNLNYLASGLQEAACRLTGLTEVGPRAASMLGAVFAGSVALGWFLRRGFRPTTALAGASLLLLDPIFAQSYRGARVDSWAFGYIFLACWWLWLAGADAGKAARWHQRWLLMGAGVCLAVAGLCWASAILLMPLVLHEFARAFLVRRTVDSLVHWSIQLLLMGAAALAATVLMLLPLGNLLPAAWADLHHGIGAVDTHSTWLAGLPVMAKSYFKSPGLFLVGLAALCLPANRWLAISFLAAAAGVAFTHPYLFRALYLLPYLLLGFCGLLELAARSEGSHPARYKLTCRLAAICLGCSALVTLGLRTYTALAQRHDRQPERMEEVARAAIGPKAVNVYVAPYEFYYAGRRLGWRQFQLQDRRLPDNVREMSNFLAGMNFVILRSGDTNNPPLQKLLEQQGFTLGRKVKAGKTGAGLQHHERDGRQIAVGYGEYLIYSKDSPPAAENPGALPRMGADGLMPARQ